MTEDELMEVAHEHPGIFGLACRLRGRVQVDPATDEMTKAALWMEVAEDPDGARELLEGLLR